MEWSGSSRRSSGSGTRLRLRAMPQRTASHREHASEIQKRYGYRPSSDPAESFQLLRRLYTRATLSAERPSVLFDRATARLVERKVLLPGVTVLERLVSSVRNRAVKRLWCFLSALPTPEQRATLDAMLLVPEGSPTIEPGPSTTLSDHDQRPSPVPSTRTPQRDREARHERS